MLFSHTLNENIDPNTNMAVEALTKRMGCNYIDANEGLRDNHGRLKAEYTIEGFICMQTDIRWFSTISRKYL